MTIIASERLGFAQAAAALGVTHAALALALERGEIARASESPDGQPVFERREIERCRADRGGRAPLPARDFDAAAVIRAAVELPDERAAAKILSDAIRAAAGPRCRCVALLRLDDEQELIRVVGVSDIPELDDLRRLLGQPLDLFEARCADYGHPGFRAALHDGVPFETESLADLLPQPNQHVAPAFVALLDARGALVLPLLRAGATHWAAMLVFDVQPRTLPIRRREAVRDFAAQAGLALEAGRLRRELAQRTAQADALHDTTRMLAHSVDLPTLLERLAELAVATLGGDGAAVLLSRDLDDTREFRLGAATGLDVAARDWIADTSSSHLIGRVATGVGSLQVTDASGTTTLSLPRLAGGRRTLAALCAPIAIGSELLGAIEVYSAAPRTFADEESDLLVSFADQAAVALQALRTQEGRQRALLGAVEALASAVEARDGYTGEHCKQLVKRAVQLARGLGFSEREIETIGLAAALHDIGKIATPDAILNKPGPLTPEELEILRRHPLVGEQIVAWVPELQHVATIIGAHQERWDGSGYPLGLTGEEIPLGARIIAVVDAYAAMTESRPYRGGLGHLAALDELLAGSGTQFDPKMVAAFMEVTANPVTGPLPPLPSLTAARRQRAPGSANLSTGSSSELPRRPGTEYLPVRRWQSRRASELAALNDILRAISSTLDLRKIYDLVYRKIKDLMDVDAFVILQPSAPVGTTQA